MFRSILGKLSQEDSDSKMADSISIEEFEAALDRYEDVLEVKARSVKGETSLEELDQFRYVEAPAQFSKKTGRLMDLKDIQKLLEWKLRHGKFRPSLPKQVASNSDEKVHEACKDGFDHYAAHPDDIQAVIKKLTAPLKGIGPATASLLLAVHDPANVIFFSDEVYAWLVGKGKSSGISYTAKEFEQIFTASTALAKRLDVSPIDIEKVAYAIIRENEPVHTPKPKKEPSGLPRGRPKMAEHEKKPKKESSGLPRGRPKLPESQKKAKPEPKPKKEKAEPTGLPRGRPRKSDAESVVATPKRGRPSVNKAGVAPPASASKATPGSTGKGRGRPKKVVDEVATPASAKRKADDEKPGRGRPKKVKT